MTVSSGGSVVVEVVWQWRVALFAQMHPSNCMYIYQFINYMVMHVNQAHTHTHTHTHHGSSVFSQPYK